MASFLVSCHFSKSLNKATLLMAATSFLITEEDPILPVQQLLNDDTLLRILPNDKKEIVQCLDGTYLDKSTLTCKFENLRPPQVLVGISPQVRPHSAHPHPDMCPSGRIGDFENPENCRSFVSCGASGAYLVHCAENLLYNEVLNQCDWPKESVCCEFKEKNSSRLLQNAE
ncbi:hypothetical protein NQ315_009489 [Exocentrus adspersus]|uniref:Chitin-binding type-2 domain-containing protein n=1 Tax=Exocentrus adspersus TaxID=1586481 RepID=A0AAV8WG88_9CUCU|nr:hypothetical protein NQ315_009489 [Exocentrus adspersus]